MIQYEEKDPRFPEMWIPLSVVHKESGETMITAHPSLKAIAEKLEQDGVSEEACEKAFLSAKEKAEEEGYVFSEEDSGFCDVFLQGQDTFADPICQTSDGRLPVLLSEADTDGDSDDPILPLCTPDLPAFGIKEENGRLLAVACTNPREEDAFGPYAQCREVGIETRPKVRGNGYAALCLKALLAELRKRKEIGMLVCSRTNTASRRCAEKAGMKCDGWMRFCVCFTEEEEEEEYGV